MPRYVAITTPFAAKTARTKVDGSRTAERTRTQDTSVTRTWTEGSRIMRMDGASLLMTAMLPWCAAAAAFHAQPFRSTAAAASHILMQDVDAMENAYIHAEVEAAASEVEVLHAQEELMPAPMAEAMKEVF